MHLSALEEYGLRCALQLARVNRQEPLAASKIAHKEGISIEYVSKLMHLFRKAGLVAASRGVQGGFFLAREPSTVKLKEIFDSVRSPGKKQNPDHCTQFSGHESTCKHLAECGIRPVWQTLYSYFDDLLDQLSLADLLASEERVRARVSEMAALRTRQVLERFQSHTSIHAEERP